MGGLSTLLAELVSLLEASGLCKNVQILESSFFSTQQFALKIRATILSSFGFQIRIYYNRNHCDYSYQVFDEEPVCRWDNAGHFPELTTFPHHFHAPDDQVIESPLKGNPVDDLKLVLAELVKLSGNREKP